MASGEMRRASSVDTAADECVHVQRDPDLPLYFVRTFGIGATTWLCCRPCAEMLCADEVDEEEEAL